jgi:hypothetical protein
VIEKIVESGLKTYYKEVCLLEQASIHGEHNGKSVAQVLKEAEGKVGGACEGDRICALCSRRGNRQAGNRLRSRSRGGQRPEEAAGQPFGRFAPGAAGRVRESDSHHG